MYRIYHLGFYLLLLDVGLGDYVNNISRKLQSICPYWYPYIFNGYTPVGNESAGLYTSPVGITTIENCTIDCCQQADCNVAFVFQGMCHHVNCTTSKLCLPLHRADLVDTSTLIMSLVKPVERTETWENLIKNTEYSHPLNPNVRRCLNSTDCSKNENCSKQTNEKNGTCKCKLGFKSNSPDGDCIPINLEDTDVHVTPSVTTTTPLSVKPIINRLSVTVVSQEVRLPENEATLEAYMIPVEQGDIPYNYAWSLLSQPKAHTGTMTGQNRKTVKLNNLSEGLYTFKVTVNGSNSYGEAYANVTVLPRELIIRKYHKKL